VWEKYLQQSMDFFPLGDCFRTQEEHTMTGSMMAASGDGSSQGSLLRKKHRDQSQHQKPAIPFSRSKTVY